MTTIVAAVPLAVAMYPKTGWPLLPAAGAMLAVALIGGARLERRSRPELWVFASTALNVQLVLALIAVLSGGPRTMLPCMLAWPVFVVGARFSSRGLIIGVPISAALVIVSTVGVDAAYVGQNPESLIVPLTLILCAAMYLSPLVASDVRHRAESTLDQLTGLLNRRGLEPRFAEVAEQAALTDQLVSVVAIDIDHFKRINDEHGHIVGDAVLRDVAYTLRKTLRTFELLYRVGGEEFLLLLPGATSEQAMSIAESLRVAVADLEPAGIAVTCSFGVDTAPAAEVRLHRMRERADNALYAAKRMGRNRVEGYIGLAASASGRVAVASR